MAEVSSKYDVTLILTKYKKMYFMSYRFIFMFSATITEHHLFLKLMYRAINQQSYKYKLLRFPLDCHLEKELSLILFDLYQKNTDLEVGDHKLTHVRIFKRHVFINQENCYFQSTSYQRRRKKGLL